MSTPPVYPSTTPTSVKPTSVKPATTKATSVGGLSPSVIKAKPTAAARTVATNRPVATARTAAIPRPAPAPVQPPATKTLAQSWEQFFLKWPEGIPERGIVVNQLGEQLPFKGFMIREDMVLLERTNPDTLGARFLITPFSEIGLVKLTDPIKQDTFEAAGYKGKLSM